jgi:hypothetical protein
LRHRESPITNLPATNRPEDVVLRTAAASLFDVLVIATCGGIDRRVGVVEADRVEEVERLSPELGDETR